MEFTTGGRLEIRISTADVGKRVSVRRLNPSGGAPGGSAERFTDTVGVLTSWEGGVLRITRRTGEIVTFDETALVAGKVVPAAPPRRRGPAATVRELQETAARGWPALETARLGDWTLRAAGGFTTRANSALPLGACGLPLPEAVDRVAAWYAERSLPAAVQITTGDPAQDALLDAELAGRGWTAERHALVRTAALAPIADTGAPTEHVRLSRTADEAWLRAYGRTGASTEDALAVLGGGPSVWFAAVPGASGDPVAVGRCVIDGRWAGFSAVAVHPDHRRRGLATQVMARLAEQALSEGASAAYLQVETDNGAAAALYDELGFTTHHAYHYRREARRP
ncbi:GNAT family N-acetyltransferase [Streptosporangium nondiastaticum]|uniref:GNAT family N-acetyltransferase n=1 Tax=Streptosporangium nondiastaticum TaxID=35764 RepID=A0A9X7JK16_9ACTN|nr:GNAT family N-acetyltransferase [Streptosporangium nondiastaticum]